MGKELDTTNAQHLLPTEKGGYANSGLKYNARCAICTAPQEIALQVNRLLISDTGFAEIVRITSPFMRAIGAEPFTVKTVKNHLDKHFDFQSDALRKIVAKRQAQIAGTYQAGVDQVIDAVVASEIIMRKGLNHLLYNEEVVPTVTETLAAAKLNNELTKDEEGLAALTEANNQLRMIIEAVQQVCTQEQKLKIFAILNGEEMPHTEFVPESDYEDAVLEITVGDDNKY